MKHRFMHTSMEATPSQAAVPTDFLTVQDPTAIDIYGGVGAGSDVPSDTFMDAKTASDIQLLTGDYKTIDGRKRK